MPSLPLVDIYRALASGDSDAGIFLDLSAEAWLPEIRRCACPCLFQTSAKALLDPCFPGFWGVFISSVLPMKSSGRTRSSIMLPTLCQAQLSFFG